MWWWVGALALVALLVAVTALVIGFLLGRRTGTRDESPEAAPNAALRAFKSAPAGQVVARADGSVVLANQVADAYGLVAVDGTLDHRVAERIAERVAESSELTAGTAVDEWELAGLHGRNEVLSMTARPLEGGLTLVTAVDETASRANEVMRRDFVANVSHELKSPVTAIGLLAEAAFEAADSPDTVRSFAERMQRETLRLGTLITEIIALSAIQGGGLHEIDLVHMDAVIADAVDRASVTASAAGITIHVDSPSGATVMGDRGLLTTAIGNLVDNAVHYSGAGSEVTVTQVVRRGIVDIAVADRGIGIAPQDQRRVFERFFRADPARSRATGGTGLGLAIVKHVAANHRGSIRLASKVGVGTTFTLRLPLAGTVATPSLIGEIEAEATTVTADSDAEV